MFDVLTEMHQYLSVNEVERSMLVNDCWKHVLKHNRALKQFRTFSSLHMNLTTQFVSRRSANMWRTGRKCLQSINVGERDEIKE